MDEDRTTVIQIGDNEYKLILTTKATKEIGKRYGGIEKFGEKLFNSKSFDHSLDELIWLITLLANQSILIHNLQHKDNQKELLTEEYVELMTTPIDLKEYKNAITECMHKGSKRNIVVDEPIGKTRKNAMTE